jgi:hypothetical protein
MPPDVTDHVYTDNKPFLVCTKIAQVVFLSRFNWEFGDWGKRKDHYIANTYFDSDAPQKTQ